MFATDINSFNEREMCFLSTDYFFEVSAVEECARD